MVLGYFPSAFGDAATELFTHHHRLQMKDVAEFGETHQQVALNRIKGGQGQFTERTDYLLTKKSLDVAPRFACLILV